MSAATVTLGRDGMGPEADEADFEASRESKGALVSARVLAYDSGNPLDGVPTARLVRESEAAGPTGAVPAYRDESGVWDYVAPGDAEHYRRHLGLDVVTIIVV